MLRRGGKQQSRGRWGRRRRTDSYSRVRKQVLNKQEIKHKKKKKE